MKGVSLDIIEKILPIVAISIVLLLGALALSPFVPALLWAGFVSVALFPFHEKLTRKFGDRRGFATGVTVLGLLVVVLFPTLFLVRSLIAVLPDLAIFVVKEGNLDQFGFDLPANMPATWHDLWNELKDDLLAMKDLIAQNLPRMLSSALIEGRLIGTFVIELFLGLTLAGVILQHAGVLTRLSTKAMQKLGGEKGLQLGEGSVQTIRYTVLGVLGSAAVQTAVATFAYWLVGATHWPLLAFATFMMGLLQVGPILIWGPMAFWLWLDNQTGLAVFLSLWGIFAVGLSDNVVKALVVSKGVRLPTTLVFLGAVGGLLVWGVVGVFLGPVILALCYELVLWWLEEEHGTGEAPATSDTTP